MGYHGKTWASKGIQLLTGWRLAFFYINQLFTFSAKTMPARVEAFRPLTHYSHFVLIASFLSRIYTRLAGHRRPRSRLRSRSSARLAVPGLAG
jgi:hypothetical protein